MKHVSKRVMAVLLAVVIICSVFPFSALAAEGDEFSVVVSMEGLTLGQGFYYEPTVYTLSRINELIAAKGYEARTAENLTAAMATLAMFIDKGVEYDNTGSIDGDSFYLSAVKVGDSGAVTVPEIIITKSGLTAEALTASGRSDPEWLGEFDYNTMTGWMITVDDSMINVGAGAYTVTDGAVIRWQYTLQGYGADLGYGWGGSSYFEPVERKDLYTAYAGCTDSAKKASVISTINKLDATQEEVDAAVAVLTESPRVAQDVSAVLNATMVQQAVDIPTPGFGTLGGEWTVLCLARGGHYEKNNAYFTGYYDRVVEAVNETAASVSLANGALSSSKSTDNSRLILALSAIGKDATSVGDWNLITPYEDFNWIKNQGINGPVFALIALDTHNYQTADTTIRQQCVDYILQSQVSGGGWAFFGSTPDPDMTGMVLQALAPYKDQEAVAAAADTAFTVLSNMQEDDGGYGSWGTINCESTAQVITACAAWGINPDTDSRFIKSGKSAVDAILTYYDSSAKAFRHTADGSVDRMATDQACYALVSYDRLLKGKTSLYDMSDVTFESSVPATDEMAAVLGLPAQVESTVGTTFNATVNLTKWDNEAGYKLIDLIVTVPEGLSVTGVTPGSRLSGGELSYNLEADTGKLRIVYFDANENSNLAISGTEYPAEVLTIGFAVENVTAGSTLPIAISGMSVKLLSDSTDENAMIIVDTANASGNVEVVQGISFSAVTVYTGDDVDLIPSNKKAVAVSVTGATRGEKLQYNDGTHEITFLYSLAISRSSKVNTYLALVDADIAMSEFVNKSNYSFPGGKADRIEFGDINGDAEVNAQDALAVVDFWLRKGEEPTDLQILTSNVNGDSRINTFDALGIVEAFVNGDPNTGYLIVTKVSTLFTNS